MTDCMNFLPKLFATLLLSALLPFTAATDYNGRRRTAGVLPGPFAEASEEIRVL